jgi:hypothetical protein
MNNVIGTYSVSSLGHIVESNTLSTEYSDIDDLLIRIKDNVGNDITASDIRDSVYTLWKKITGITPSGTSSEILYTNLLPTNITVGGILAGSTFSNANTKEMWDKLLYPYVAPFASLTGGKTRELYNFGTQQISLNWSIIKGSKSITEISFTDGKNWNPTPIPNPTILSGQILADISSTLEPNIYTMSVTDDYGNTKYYSSTVLNWSSAIYWGTTPTYECPTMVITNGETAPPWANGASVSRSGNYGKLIIDNKSGIYDGINGNGEYLVFAWPSSYGIVDPIFKINGLFNTAYQKIGSAVPHINMWGHFPVNYDVWISSTPQNAPITEFRII